MNSLLQCHTAVAIVCSHHTRFSPTAEYTSVNFPLKNGMGDEAYQRVFKPVIQEVMDRFRPGAIVLQCGADSLSGDRLCSVTGGCANACCACLPSCRVEAMTAMLRMISSFCFRYWQCRCFNLTLNGHAECVRFVKSFNIPMLVCAHHA